MPTSLTDRLFTTLEARIRGGELRPGSRLPTQREICAREKVSRTVVREAFARLAAHGLTTSRQGSGVFVARQVPLQAFQVRADELSNMADVIKLIEIRLAIESEMAALAAARRSFADIGALRDALDCMAGAGDDAAESARADTAFHLAIAQATQNEHYVRIIAFLGQRLVPPRTLYLRDRPVSTQRAYAALIHDEHDAILDAIIRMEPARARDAARAHMQESLSRHSRLGKTGRPAA
ncbi:FadR/GntR family transcriptional regulator [Sphingomonas sanxanigenens]|uniref:GntR family transcriptional regulator n=1 Tax=Sphingomonas sanxanigenens DSM 19645 = NX02 TaxID=1123269 RepID=A0A0F7JR92_9SPHN|nr:FadR/GntR family transcriptional regulator [Sphingomonas sanxanigenens]AKH18956.1 GntR family transcriptional regulator [Sphingomonas sanxanigenens DSM 19645 = NX02]